MPKTDIIPVECQQTHCPTLDLTEDVYRHEHLGTGDWEAWGPELGPLEQAIRDWKVQLQGIEKPWLCWCVLDRFCRIQQRLALEFGWTPVVGCDPRAEQPTILPGAVRFDANRLLDLPTVWLHFTFEFVYAFAPRLACWHSDLLVSRPNMENLVRVFDRLDDGETAAYRPRGWWLKNGLPCPGLACATTRGASRDQWDHGCGWWKWFCKHPNFNGPVPVEDRDWDTGRGIWYWQQHFGGVVRRVFPDEAGHCRMPWSVWKSNMTKTQAIQAYYDVDQLLRKLQIADLDDG
ncbi:MAG: hypothetical protein V3W34_04795 [Phycisphaerae bacterium]